MVEIQTTRLPQTWRRSDGSCRIMCDGWYADRLEVDRLADNKTLSQHGNLVRSRLFQKWFVKIADHPALTAWRLWRAAAKYDVIVTSQPAVSVCYGLIRAINWRKPKSNHVIVEFFTGVPNRWSVIALWPLVRVLMHYSLNSAHTILVHSSAETSIYRDLYGLHRPVLRFVRFGGTATLLTRPTTDEGFIVAAGSDNRDFESFIEAVRDIEVQAVIIAPKGTLCHRNLPPNMRLYEDCPRETYLDIISRAQVVVVPLKDKARSLGQVVLSNAISLGKPVIATRTVGTVDYIHHYETGVLVRCYDAPALRDAILNLSGDAEIRRYLGVAARKAAQDFYEEHTRALREIIDSALETRTITDGARYTTAINSKDPHQTTAHNEPVVGK